MELRPHEVRAVEVGVDNVLLARLQGAKIIEAHVPADKKDLPNPGHEAILKVLREGEIYKGIPVKFKTQASAISWCIEHYGSRWKEIPGAKELVEKLPKYTDQKEDAAVELTPKEKLPSLLRGK